MNDGVALRKESVDRNSKAFCSFSTHFVSLSARRAWIEICFARSLIAEGNGSLSARRAWIEMAVSRHPNMPAPGRSPQGERG